MNIEQQCCSANQAISLKTLGISQDSLFYWQITPDGRDNLVNATYRDTIEKILPGCNLFYSAFTVAELGTMLYDLVGLVCLDSSGNKWSYRYEGILMDSEAQARAGLLIECLESEDNYVNPQVCNERLAS